MKPLHWQMHSALSDVNPDIFKGLIGLMADPNENCISGGVPHKLETSEKFQI